MENTKREYYATVTVMEPDAPERVQEAIDTFGADIGMSVYGPVGNEESDPFTDVMVTLRTPATLERTAHAIFRHMFPSPDFKYVITDMGEVDG